LLHWLGNQLLYSRPTDNNFCNNIKYGSVKLAKERKSQLIVNLDACQLGSSIAKAVAAQVKIMTTVIISAHIF